MEKGSVSRSALPSVKIKRTLGLSGLSPPDSVNSSELASLRALSVAVEPFKYGIDATSFLRFSSLGKENKIVMQVAA